MPDEPPNAQYLTGTDSLSLIGQTYDNIKQDVIRITADRATIYLMEWRAKLVSERAWVAPLSLLASLLLTLTTAADYKDTFGVSKANWAAIYTIGSVAAFIWLVLDAWHSYRRRPESIHSLVERFKLGDAEGDAFGRAATKLSSES
jgi:hypothetical protein